MLHPWGDFDRAYGKPQHWWEGCCGRAAPGEQRQAAKMNLEAGEAAPGWGDQQQPRVHGHLPKRGAPAAPGALAQPCMPVPSRGQLFLALTKLLHARIITLAQSSSGGRSWCGAAISLLPSIFSYGPSWERAWPQHHGRSLEEEPGPTAPPGSSGQTMAWRGWKSALASQGWRQEWGWAVQPLGDPARGKPYPLPDTQDATHGVLG